MKKPKKVIVLQKNGHVSTWVSLRRLCDDKGFPYWTLSKKAYPFDYKGYRFEKTELKGSQKLKNHE